MVQSRCTQKDALSTPVVRLPSLSILGSDPLRICGIAGSGGECGPAGQCVRLEDAEGGQEDWAARAFRLVCVEKGEERTLLFAGTLCQDVEDRRIRPDWGERLGEKRCLGENECALRDGARYEKPEASGWRRRLLVAGGEVVGLGSGLALLATAGVG